MPPAPSQTGLEPGEVLEKLPSLDRLLRERNCLRGPDTWQSVHDLLLMLHHQSRFPQTLSALTEYLSPLLCRSPEEQHAFPRLCELWFNGAADTATASIEVPPGSRKGAPAGEVRKRWLQHRLKQGMLAALILILLIADGYGLARIIWPDPIPGPPPTPVETLKPPPSAASSDNTTGRPAAKLDPWVPPNTNRLQYHLADAQQQTLRQIPYALAAVPWIVALLTLIRRYRPYWLVSRNPVDDGSKMLNRFHLRGRQRLFGGDGSGRLLNPLKNSVSQPSRRLDVPATVEATARRAGYFQPRYRERRTQTSFLVLVNSLKPADHRAELAAELVQRFREAQLTVDYYRFAGDPRCLFVWDQHRTGTSSLQDVARRHPDASLIIISETAVLFHPLDGSVRPWADAFGTWPKRFWLWPERPSSGATEALMARNFCVLPLGQTAISGIIAWLFSDQHRAPEPDWGRLTVQPPLPDILADASVWLTPRPPAAEAIAALLRALRRYLGEDGMRLLTTVAAYPEPRWNLTLAMDYQLAEHHPDWLHLQERRLSRISRLPWLRQAYMPDYLREALLRQLDVSGRQAIGRAWASLLDGLTSLPQDGGLELPLTAPPPRRLYQRLLALRLGRNPPAAANDPIFINLLFDGRLGLLDFTLPRQIARHLPVFRRFFNLWPLLRISAAAGLACLLILWMWQGWGENRFRAYLEDQQRQRNAEYAINLTYPPSQQALAEFLKQRLTASGFRVTDAGAATGTATQPEPTSTADTDGNTLGYSADAFGLAGTIQREVSHAGFGLATRVDAEADPSLASKTLHVSLTASPPQLTRFNDSLKPKNAPPRPGDVFSDPFKGNDRAFGPAMVALPGGTFMMGCDGGTDTCQSDEQPAHRVTVRPFALGRHEVSFADYDAYDASLPDHKNPLPGCETVNTELKNDSGRGRGSRPVVNITWDQARCYAAWLSDQTGQTYRLPSEAEWEYALRAGQDTAYPWGQDAEAADLYAWYFANSDNQTHPAGLKRPNGFGLYDMSGNVWEWVADCYHDTYEGAPSEGSVWEQTGDCKGRGLRGGSWDGLPQDLRSAYRFRVAPVGAYDNIGFRLARAL